eukprot:TRINITY_DN2363_c0_g2_i1.p1 TRINITY_DN2363_c0_g2~~TRINITY_DN2363_c0_g2_i1.p1  ORF type:complete len:1495 (-),score=195.61 TRINITY_DN2363_c0_g2_i1:117-4601(-)
MLFLSHRWLSLTSAAVVAGQSTTTTATLCALPSKGPLWSVTLPQNGAADDYAAETECNSPASSVAAGIGCQTCYGPDLEAVAAPPGGIDVGGAADLLLHFEGLGGRHLLVKPALRLEVSWGTYSGSDAVTERFDLRAASFRPAYGKAHVNRYGQLDSGPVLGSSGLEMVRSGAALTPPLVRPLGFDLLLSLKLTFAYVIAGCRTGAEGSGSVKLSIEAYNRAYNLSSCASASRPCTPACQAGFTGGGRTWCSSPGGAARLEGCRADCAAVPSFHPHKRPDGVKYAADVTCAEGLSVADGSRCTTQCSLGWTPVPAVLSCTDGRFSPSKFTCYSDCAAPPPSRGSATPACAELLVYANVPHGSRCTPRCEAGFHPVPKRGLVCNDGHLDPPSFYCHPLLIEASAVRVPGADRSSFFRIPNGTLYMALASHAEEAAGSGVFRVTPSSDGMTPWHMQRVSDLTTSTSDVQAVAAAVVDGGDALLLVATAGSGGSGHSSILRWNSCSGNVERVHLLEHEAANVHVHVGSVGGQAALFQASAKDAAILSWNGSHFRRVQNLGVSADVLLPFELGGVSFAFALSRYELSTLHRWFGKVTPGPPTELNLSNGSSSGELSCQGSSSGSDRIGTRLHDFRIAGAFNQTATLRIEGATAAAWLGCRDDPAFFDSSGLACHQLRLLAAPLAREACARDAAIRASCGALCGCAHDAPLLAVGVSDPLPRVLVLRVGDNGTSLSELAAAKSLGPTQALCSLFVPTHGVQYVVAASSAVAGSTEATSAVFAWREGGLELVQRLALAGNDDTALAPAAGSCAAMAGEIHSLLYLGATPVVGAPTGSNVRLEQTPSSLYVVEGSFEWEVSPWGKCSRECLMPSQSPSVRFRSRACRAVPSGTLYPNSTCPIPAPEAEERCNVPLCSSLAYIWQPTVWSECRGECGVGRRYREVPCIRASTGDVADPQLCDQVRPALEKWCKLEPCASHRIVNLVAVRRSWHVVEVGLYVDEDCSQKIEGEPFAAGACEACFCRNATGSWGSCGPELAFDDHVPYRASDGSLQAGTAWISACGAQMQCSPGEAWVGLHVNNNNDVRCVRFMQIGDADHLATDVALDAWDIVTATWKTVAEWSGLQGGRWETLLVPRLCSSTLDCSDHGRVVGIPGRCSCICSKGYRGVNCELCAPGFEGYPNCTVQQTASEKWRVVAASAAPGGQWHVADISLHSSLLCDEASLISSDVILDFPAYAGPGSTLEAARVFDAARRTVWAADCGGGPSCAEDAWVGVQFQDATRIRCLRFLQGSGGYAVDKVVLEMWSSSQWIHVKHFSNLIARGRDAGARSGMPTGHVSLRVVCDDGRPIGAHTTSDCGADMQPWDRCSASCEEGYAGTSTAFVCDDTYTFHGVLPDCLPNECVSSPEWTQEVDAADCIGKKTQELCTATCAEGLFGEPVSYICTSDGSLRQAGSLDPEVVPVCSTYAKTEVSSASSILYKIAWLLLAIIGHVYELDTRRTA